MAYILVLESLSWELPCRYFKVVLNFYIILYYFFIVGSITEQPHSKKKGQLKVPKAKWLIRTLFHDTVWSIFLFQGIPVCREFLLLCPAVLEEHWWGDSPRFKTAGIKREKWHLQQSNTKLCIISHSHKTQRNSDPQILIIFIWLKRK